MNYSFAFWVAAFFVVGCSNDQPTGPQKTDSFKRKVLSQDSNQTNTTPKLTKARFPHSGYFEVKTPAEREEAGKLLPNSIVGQNSKPPSEQIFTPKVGGPSAPSDPEWRALTRITNPFGNPDDLYHESTSSSTFTIDYIDVLHEFYQNGQLIGSGFDSDSPGYYATVGRIEAGIGQPGYLWEAWGYHAFRELPFEWYPWTYDSTVQ